LAIFTHSKNLTGPIRLWANVLESRHEPLVLRAPSFKDAGARRPFPAACLRQRYPARAAGFRARWR